MLFFNIFVLCFCFNMHEISQWQTSQKAVEGMKKVRCPCEVEQGLSTTKFHYLGPRPHFSFDSILVGEGECLDMN